MSDFNRFITDATANTEALNLTQEERIAKLREEINKLGGTAMSLDDLPADVEEEFLRHVLEYETATPISIFQMLENAGLVLPVPETLNWNFDSDGTGLKKLDETIKAMANIGAYLLHTNHKSDRELYEYLYFDGLREEAVLFPENPYYAYMIDLTGSGSEEDNNIYLKFYADEEHRQQWAKDWPDDFMPVKETPPFNRDKDLPVAPIGR